MPLPAILTGIVSTLRGFGTALKAGGIQALTGLLGGGNNQQQGRSTGPLVQDPNPPVKVRNVNSPITPDSVVGLNELPSQSAILPNVKLEDIKLRYLSITRLGTPFADDQIGLFTSMTLSVPPIATILGTTTASHVTPQELRLIHLRAQAP